jgi:hypothetical protein
LPDPPLSESSPTPPSNSSSPSPACTKSSPSPQNQVVAGSGLQQEVVERAEGDVVKADAIRPLAGEYEDARRSAHAVGPLDG